MELEMKDTMRDVLDDADAVFGFDRDATYQQRAHGYLRERGVSRGFDDTAVQCVVRDLIARAVSATSEETMRERMVSAAADLLQLAREMGAGDGR